MNGLLFLFLTTIKNSIKEFFKNPGKIVAALFFLVFIGFAIAGTLMGDTKNTSSFRDISELYAIIFTVFLIMFTLVVYKGFSSGASFFSMSDVNFLFSSPISPKVILIYGLIKQLGTTFIFGFFLLFQFGWLHSTYGLTISGLLAIILGYCLVVFCGQLISMIIYSFTSSDEFKKKIVKFSFIAVGIVLIVAVVLPLLKSSHNKISTAVSSINTVWFDFVPIVGWLRSTVVYLINGDAAYSLLGFLATIILVFALLYVLTKARADYYEDVIKATEVSFSAITSKKEGKIVEAVPINVKVGKTGIDKGVGSGVFYYKHMLENRRAKLFILDTTTILLSVSVIIFALIMRSNGIIPVFIFATYMQIFSSAMGRWIRELLLPYVYLIPESAFQKLLMICKENVYKICVEAIIVFVPVAFIVKASILEAIACVLARIGFGFLFMAGNILSQRLLGSIVSKIVIFTLYIFVMILIAAPGIILGVVIGSFASDGIQMAMGLFITFVYNLAISALITYLCRDILNYAELNYR